MKHTLLYMLICLWAFPAQGQKVAQSNIRIEHARFEKGLQDSLTVNATFILPPEMKISSNRGVAFTPVITDKVHRQSLPPIWVYGRKREIVSERNHRIPANSYRVVRRKRKTEQTIAYQVTLPYQVWMSSAQLRMVEDLCGCGNYSDESHEYQLTSLPSWTEAPQVAAPVHEAVLPVTPQLRVIEGDANIYYPLNCTILFPNYLDNTAELGRITASIDSIPRMCIRSITLHGYASPEGSYSHNTQLAEGRVAALKQYLLSKYRFADTLVVVHSTPEDWATLRKQVEASDIEGKEEILAIIDSNEEPDSKCLTLKRLRQNVPYQYIYREWFPRLRHTTYRIEYIDDGSIISPNKKK